MDVIASAAVAISLVATWLIRKLSRMSSLRKQNADGWTCLCIEFKRRLGVVLDIIDRSGATDAVYDAREQVENSITREERFNAERAITSAISSMLRYKNADERLGIDETDAPILSALVYYNNTAEEFNKCVGTFPGSLISRIFGFRRVPCFDMSGIALDAAITSPPSTR